MGGWGNMMKPECLSESIDIYGLVQHLGRLGNGSNKGAQHLISNTNIEGSNLHQSRFVGLKQRNKLWPDSYHKLFWIWSLFVELLNYDLEITIVKLL